MTITLPDELRAELEQRAKASGFASVDAYVAYLVVSDDPADASDDLPDPPPGASYVVGSRAELEAKLQEALDSGPATEMTPADWADLRRRVAERLARREVG